MRLMFADEIVLQHLTRKFPEFLTDPDARVSDDTINARTRTMIVAVQQARSAAIDFTSAALGAYLEGLPDGIVRTRT